MPKKKKLTPREKVTYLIRVLHGESLKAVADAAGVSEHTVKAWCRTAGVSGKPTKTRTSAEEFVRTWQAAESLLEVSLALSMSANAASQRAGNYRRRGVRLKHMPRASQIDWSHLADLAEQPDEQG